MVKFWAVFKREYLERVRTKWFVIGTVFGPLLFSAIMIVPGYLSVKSMRETRLSRVEILDATGTDLGAQVRSRLLGPMADTATVTLQSVAPEALAQAESLATAAVRQKSISGYVVLDSATLAGTSARYAGRNASTMGEMEMIEGAIRQSVLKGRLEREGLDPARIDALTRVRISLERERISDKGRGGSGMASTALGLILAFLLYMSLILYGQNILRSVLEEKTTRVAEVIVASVKTDTLLAGKVLGVAAVGLTQQVFWAASAFAMYNARGAIFAKLGLGAVPAFTLPQVTLGIGIAFFLFFLLGFVFYSSLFAAAGATVSSDQEAQQAAQPIMMLLIASIIFVQPILIAPSSTMAKALSWLPFSAPIVMPLRMSVVPLGAMEISLVLLGLAASCALVIWLSARIYRIGLLMYGKRPSFKEVGRWVMQS